MEQKKKLKICPFRGILTHASSGKHIDPPNRNKRIGTSFMTSMNIGSILKFGWDNIMRGFPLRKI